MLENKELYLKLLHSLESALHDVGMKTMLCDERGLWMLKARLVGLGSAEGEALMEICVPDAKFAGENEQPLALLQFYTTLASHIDADNEVPALKELNRLNMNCPLGSLHLFLNGAQLYHRYTLPLRGETLEDFLLAAADALHLAVEVLDTIFDDALLIAHDASKSRYGREEDSL